MTPSSVIGVLPIACVPGLICALIGSVTDISPSLVVLKPELETER